MRNIITKKAIAVSLLASCFITGQVAAQEPPMPIPDTTGLPPPDPILNTSNVSNPEDFIKLELWKKASSEASASEKVATFKNEEGVSSENTAIIDGDPTLYDIKIVIDLLKFGVLQKQAGALDVVQASSARRQMSRINFADTCRIMQPRYKIMLRNTQPLEHFFLSYNALVSSPDHEVVDVKNGTLSFFFKENLPEKAFNPKGLTSGRCVMSVAIVPANVYSKYVDVNAPGYSEPPESIYLQPEDVILRSFTVNLKVKE